MPHQLLIDHCISSVVKSIKRCLEKDIKQQTTQCRERCFFYQCYRARSSFRHNINHLGSYQFRDTHHVRQYRAQTSMSMLSCLQLNILTKCWRFIAQKISICSARQATFD
jgi:hypothetical protein